MFHAIPAISPDFPWDVLGSSLDFLGTWIYEQVIDNVSWCAEKQSLSCTGQCRLGKCAVYWNRTMWTRWCARCSLYFRWIFAGFSLNWQCMFPEFSLDVPCYSCHLAWFSLGCPWIFFGLPWMFRVFTMDSGTRAWHRCMAPAASGEIAKRTHHIWAMQRKHLA